MVMVSQLSVRVAGAVLVVTTSGVSATIAPDGTVTATTAPWLPAPIDRALATFGNPGMYQLHRSGRRHGLTDPGHRASTSRSAPSRCSTSDRSGSALLAFGPSNVVRLAAAPRCPPPRRGPPRRG